MIQHLGEEKQASGPVVPPIVQTSLFVHQDLDTFWGTMFDHDVTKPNYIYSRVGNPNLTVAEKKIAALEGTEAAILFASGMAAISAAILSSVATGGHIVYVDTCYGPTKHFIEEYLPRFGITGTPVKGDSNEEVFNSVRENTQVLYLESPSSLVFRLQDIEALCHFAKSREIVTILDNSYSSPINQQPASFGVDLVCHSATKFISGHSDVVAGVVCGTKARMQRIMEQEGQWLGALLPPFPAWLLLRGLRTLPLRMEASQKCGESLFKFLQSRSEVESIMHVGDPDFPQGDLRSKQMTGTTSLLSFRPKVQDVDKIKAFIHDLELFQIGVSWGGFESLAIPIPLTPGDPPTNWIIRLYGGLEDPVDLCAALDKAMVHLR